MAMLRTVAHEVGNAERGCHMNQLRHERASQELAQPRRWWCLLRTIFRGHEISAHVGQWAKGFSRSFGHLISQRRRDVAVSSGVAVFDK